jgi:hypothetical protein
VCLVILALVLIRVPALVFWNDYMTGHDAAIYMEKAINLNEGEGFVSSICRHIRNKEDLENYIDKFGMQRQEIKVAPLYIYIISILYRYFGIEYFMLSINILNLLLFVMILVMLYSFMLITYRDNMIVQIGTLLFIGLNSLMLELSYGAHMEILNLFLFVGIFIYHVYYVNLSKPPIYKTLFYTIGLTLLFLSKYSAIPFVVGFVLHHLYLKNYRQFIIISVLVFIGTGSWFILRDIIMDGRIISDFNGFPFSDAQKKISGVPILATIMLVLFFIQGYVEMIIGFNGLAFLFPFALISLIDYKNKTSKQLLIVIFLVSTVIYCYLYSVYVPGGYLSLRYIYPALVFMIPLSLLELDKLLSNINKNKGKIILYILLSFFAIYNITEIVKFTYDVKRKSLDRASIYLAADELIREEDVSHNQNILTNIVGYNVYSDVGIVLAPSEINYTNKYEIIQTYNIDYVLFAQDQRNHWASWDQNVVPQDIFTDLHLIKISKIDERVKLYSIKQTNNNNYYIN